MSFNFAHYWHLWHMEKPEMKELTIEHLCQMANLPLWMAESDAECLTKEGAQNDSLTPPTSPAELINKVLAFQQMTQSELAYKLEISRAMMSAICHSEKAISLDLALRMERALSIPAHLILRLQTDYILFSYRHTHAC